MEYLWRDSYASSSSKSNFYITKILFYFSRNWSPFYADTIFQYFTVDPVFDNLFFSIPRQSTQQILSPRSTFFDSEEILSKWKQVSPILEYNNKLLPLEDSRDVVNWIDGNEGWNIRVPFQWWSKGSERAKSFWCAKTRKEDQRLQLYLSLPCTERPPHAPTHRQKDILKIQTKNKKPSIHSYHLLGTPLYAFFGFHSVGEVVVAFGVLSILAAFLPVLPTTLPASKDWWLH